MEHMVKLRTKTEPVEMPSQFCDYWMVKGPVHEGVPAKCSYCDEPIEKGDRFFYLIAVSGEASEKIFVADRDTFVSVSKRGHVSHLVPAPQREWKHDPSKRVLQPWEEDPTIPAPPGWEKWKKDHEGTLYG